MDLQTFRLTYEYDKEIHNWFSKNDQQNDIKLRYGENPNQSAILKTKDKSLTNFQIQGKEIGYNNILDVDSGLDFINEFIEHCL